MTLRILACQILVPPTRRRADKEAHVRRVAQTIDRALGDEQVHLVVLPELSTIEYSREAFGQLADLAEDVEGATSQVFGALARRHGVNIVYGMPRRESGRYFISQVVLGPDGAVRGFYDKVHIAQFGASM